MKQINFYVKGNRNLEYNYIVFLPDGYKKNSKNKKPLIMFLHGAFERGNDLEILKRNALPKFITTTDLPFIIIAPQCPLQMHWNPNSIELILDVVVKNYDVDETKIYLTGLSMGGFGTWQIAARNPDRYAAIIPICGGGNTINANRLVDVPIWAFHGKKDKVIDVWHSEEMVNAVNEKGGNAKLTVYPHAEHDSWTETYNNLEIYDWLLSKTKNIK